MPIIEISLDDLRIDYDWACVFGEQDTGGNCSQNVEAVDESTPCDPCYRKDVQEIIAAVNGENDGDEWVGVFQMNDGRFLVAKGSCDYTGWD